jgi:long-chain acyl-CoA synthetase
MILTRMQEAASHYPNRIAIQFKESDGYCSYTYRELIDTVVRVGGSLAGLDISKGDRVAILSENRPEWVIAYLAVTSVGAVIVPLDAQLASKEVALLLANSDAKAVCVSRFTREKLPSGGPVRVISFDAGDGVLFSDLIQPRGGLSLPQPPADGDLAAILYTSGTTGDPKGVMLSHRNLAANCASVIKLGIALPEDNLLCLLPLHHTYPAIAGILLPLSIGATVTFLNSLKGPDIITCMQETGVSVLVGVPQLLAALRRAIFEQIENNPLPVKLLASMLLGLNSLVRRILGMNIGKALFGKVHARFGPKFRLMASGGARLEPDVFNDLSNLGFMLIEGYGLTETSPVATFNPIGRQKAGSIGIPVPDVEVRIVDPDESGMGEIAIKGPNVMLGYYKKPQATDEVIRGGWFYSGDLGYRDRDGYFFITGRSKEMIVLSSGKKIFPDELEKFYKQLQSIKEICVLQTDRGLEAAVVPDFEYLKRMNIANARETIAFEIEDLSKDLAPYKRISGLKVFKDPLPVTRLGKLRRAKVKDLYLTGGERSEKAAQAEDAAVLESDAGRKVVACLAPFSVKKQIVPDDNLEIDLGLDSLSRIELVVSLEQTFGVSLPDSFGSEVYTVREVINKMQDVMASGISRAGLHVRLSWAEILRQEPTAEAKGMVRNNRSVLCLLGWYCCRLTLKAIFGLLGGTKVRGADNLPKTGPYLITPNHLSNTDAFLLTTAMPAGVGKQAFYLGDTKYFGGPISSRIAAYIQVIPVDMEARLYNALQLSAYILRQDRVLCVFPEGSRSRDGNIKEFKKGVGIIAKELNVPLVPAAITGTFEMMRPGKLFPRRARTTVTFGEPFSPGGMTYEEIVERLHNEVSGLLELGPDKAGA